MQSKARKNFIRDTADNIFQINNAAKGYGRGVSESVSKFIDDQFNSYSQRFAKSLRDCLSNFYKFAREDKLRYYVDQHMNAIESWKSFIQGKTIDFFPEEYYDSKSTNRICDLINVKAKFLENIVYSFNDVAKLHLVGGPTEKKAPKISDLLRDLEELCKSNPEFPLAEYIDARHPVISELLSGAPRKQEATTLANVTSEGALESPPLKWLTDRLPGELPADFIHRAYGQWLGKGLTRANIRSLDRPLYTALSKWLTNNSMPPHIDLPTARERNDRWIDRIAEQGGAPLDDAKEAMRLASALRRRARPRD